MAAKSREKWRKMSFYEMIVLSRRDDAKEVEKILTPVGEIAFWVGERNYVK